MCLLAVVAGHGIPNQGSIAQNKAGPPGVGEQKPMSCLMSYSYYPRPGIASDAASCPGPHPQRRHRPLGANSRSASCLLAARPGLGYFNPSGTAFPSIK